MNLNHLSFPKTSLDLSHHIVIMAELDKFGHIEPILLSQAELARAQNITDDVTRKRFIAGRTLLRQLLSHYIDCNPADIELITGSSGKPALKDQSIEFNISHSKNWYGFAFSKSPIGLDLEEFKSTNRNLLGIARRFFTETETNFLSKSAADTLPQQFYKLWTQKEAVLKAHGGGISAGLNQLDLIHHRHRLNHSNYQLMYAELVANLYCSLAIENASPTHSTTYYILSPALEMKTLEPLYRENTSLLSELL